MCGFRRPSSLVDEGLCGALDRLERSLEYCILVDMEVNLRLCLRRRCSLYSTGPSGGSGSSFTDPESLKSIVDRSGTMNLSATLGRWTAVILLARRVDAPAADQGEDTLEAVSKVKMEAILGPNQPIFPIMACLLCLIVPLVRITAV